MTLDLNNARDLSGNSRHLTLGGSAVPAVVADPWGIGQGALTFAGEASLIAAGPSFNLPSGDYTWECRFKRNTGANGTTQILFARWGSVAAEWGYILFFDSANKLNYGHGLSASQTIITAGSATTDGSAHAVAVVKSSGNISLYLDGARVAGPTAVASTLVVPASIPLRVADYDDADLPFFGTIGDLRFSDSARYTGASYTVPTAAFSPDANTLALLPLSGLAGNYLGAPAYQSNILLRTGYAQASGGWANPDGPIRALDGSWYLTASAYNGTTWTVWAVTAPTLSGLLSGSGTVQSAAIQTPAAGEGTIAGNGSVVPWSGTYYHYYQDGTPNVRYSTGSSLGSAFSTGTTIFSPGVGGYDSYFDPWVRPSPDNTYLEMFLCANVGTTRYHLRSTSTDGTTWATPTLVAEAAQAGYRASSPGEPSSARFAGSYWLLGDGAATAGSRVVMRWASPDGSTWLPCKRLISPAGGSYLAAYDSSPYYDAGNARLVVLAAHSTNTNLAQPTDSDIGMWYVPIAGLAGIFRPAALDGLGGAGGQASNPSLSGA